MVAEIDILCKALGAKEGIIMTLIFCANVGNFFPFVPKAVGAPRTDDLLLNHSELSFVLNYFIK